MKLLLLQKYGISIMLVLFIVLDLYLILMILKINRGYEECKNQNHNNYHELTEYQEYISKGVILSNVDFNELSPILMDNNITQSIGDNIYVVLLSKDICESCFSRLLSVFLENSIKPEFCYILSEDSLNQLTIQDWEDQGFILSNWKYVESIYGRHLLEEEIVVLRLGPAINQTSFFIFDPEIESLENYFHH